MPLSPEFPSHIKLLSPLSFLFVLFFVCLFVFRLFICFSAVRGKTNKRMGLPQMD